jgi:hypothetical protein
MKKLTKNQIIDKVIYESMEKYLQEAAEVIAQQICENCPLKNPNCEIEPCSSAANMIINYANKQIAYTAMAN